MKSLSIHIGLNLVDPIHYEGWDGALVACEQDARDMRGIAESNGYLPTLVLTADATSNRLLGELSSAATALEAGDTLLVTYSGHGGQIPDENHDEVDGMDETWVMYDRMVTDDELFNAWARFVPGVRILVLSDSCHSGTVLKQMLLAADRALARQRFMEELGMSHARTPRAIPPVVQDATYQRHKGLYDSAQRAAPKGDSASVGASVLLISGCQDNQLSYDGPVNGAFTGQLLKVWNKGAFAGDHREFHKRIAAGLPEIQSPNFYTVGAPNPGFEREVPFKRHSAPGSH